MSILIFIDSNIPDYQVFADSVKVPIGDFSLNTFNSNINRIGFVWENNKRQIPFGSVPYEYEQTSEMLPDQPINNTTYYFTKEFVDYLAQFTDPITVDLITCSLVTPVFTSNLEQIKKLLPNVTFNYSVNLTGNAPQGDWIMESSGEDIKSIYFNDIIYTYSHVLALPIRIDHAFIFSNHFGGALFTSINENSATYTWPTNAQNWAGFGSLNTSYYPLKFTNGGKIEFEAVVSSNVTIRFKFEKLPYNNNDPTATEPSFFTESVTITPQISNYTINIPSQGVNTFSNFLLFVNTKDVPIQLSQLYLSDDPPPAPAIISSLVRTGGDPIIQPLIGQKFALATHIKYVNLLADYSKKIFINAQVEMLTESDFPEEIYWDKSFSKTTELTHIYSNSYYRRFFIYYDGESVEIDADTLKINKITTLNKIKMISINPKTGLKSISFDKIYPLLDSTKGIKLGFDNYLLTITSDINTDDRHHLELLNVKEFNMEQTSGALISKDRIIRISNLAGPELFQFDSNPFESTQITN